MNNFVGIGSTNGVYICIIFWITGAYESRKWKSILYNLYDLLVNEISQIGSRGKYSSGSRNIAVKENLIDLMADVCHQVQQVLSHFKISC